MGSIYAFPLYTRRLLEAGLSPSEVTLLGVASQAGLGLLPMPLHFLAQALEARMTLERADRVLVTATSALLIMSLVGIGMLLKRRGERSSGEEPGSVDVLPLALLFLAYGCGTGATFVHTVNVVNFNLFHHAQTRRLGTAALPLGLATGGLLSVVVYQYCLSSLPLSSVLYVFAGIFVVLWLARLAVFTRAAGHRLPSAATGDPEDPDPVVGRAGAAEVQPLASPGSLRAPAPASAQPDSESEVPSTAAWDYASHPVVWLTCGTTAFGIGAGAAFGSSIGNLVVAGTGEEAGDASDNLTFNATLIFIAAQVVGRAVSAVVYAYENESRLMFIWQLAILLGFAATTLRISLAATYASSALIGLGFGGIWTVIPVIASFDFPGGQHDYIKGLSLCFFAGSVGSISLGQAQTALLEVEPWARVNSSEYFTPFLVFLCLSGVSSLAAAVLAHKLRHHHAAAAAVQVKDEPKPSTLETFSSLTET